MTTASPFILITKDQFEQLQKRQKTVDDSDTHTTDNEEDTVDDKYLRKEIEKEFDKEENERSIIPILNAMERSPGILSYDIGSGMVIYKRAEIPGSNIIDILKDILEAKSDSPIGKFQFFQGLAQIGLGKKYILNRKNKQYLKKIIEKRKTHKQKTHKRKQNKKQPTKSSDNTNWVSWN